MSVWFDDGRAAGAGRGRRGQSGTAPGLDRERITAATVRLLDAEGPAKFSMRRLAADLGVTAMSLYWYVDSKDDLLELASDAVMGEVELPEAPPPGGDWQSRIRDLAAGYRALLIRHPWLSPLVGRFLNVGPNWSAFALCVQRIIRSTGLAPEHQTGALAAVFQFVYGFGTIEANFLKRCAESGLTQDQFFSYAMGAISREPELTPVVDASREMVEARGGQTVQEMRDRDFAFALDVLIAGIEARRRDSLPDPR
ncbi:TetR/AcrR family transcriptional regulator C-terminal domain-containing protein [Streptomyces sp. MUM 203J]|uniref:TetR/AcrR family transcriptional regulator n=1 Tax=Streptomyces sp. MUM 203J TaxID=2791990 RepID=UPI001F041A03|nr:TetR/AcrR family transcriptional regulator [Streptomyces sp. MUM 203J]MCH0541948.1 TetR/AcrR family transcriptional regulator C-terminal domain-containing protein [Streptomyces sp. MUM 203J]